MNKKILQITTQIQSQLRTEASSTQIIEKSLNLQHERANIFLLLILIFFIIIISCCYILTCGQVRCHQCLNRKRLIWDESAEWLFLCNGICNGIKCLILQQQQKTIHNHYPQPPAVQHVDRMQFQSNRNEQQIQVFGKVNLIANVQAKVQYITTWVSIVALAIDNNIVITKLINKIWEN